MSKREENIAEAVERLILMEVEEEDRKKYEEEQEIPCYFVDHWERKIRKTSLTEEQKDVIAYLEEKREMPVYYAIIDRGMWPVGFTFERWSFLIISSYEEDWDLEKSIINSGRVYAYVYNRDMPECSDLVEMPFRNVNGIIINTA